MRVRQGAQRFRGIIDDDLGHVLVDLVLDEDGQPVLDERGKPAKDIVRVMPAQIKEALDRNRSEYLQSLSEKARGAREGSERLGNGDRRAAQSRESIAM